MSYSANKSPSVSPDNVYASDDVARQLIKQKRAKNDYFDLDLKFTKNPNTGDISARRGSSSVKQSIKNLVLTENYEIPFKPEVGCSVKSLLFEPMDFVTEQRITDSIKSVIQNYEPRVEFLTVTVKAEHENHGYNITIVFSVNNSNEKETITTFLSSTRG
tara:strand:- start:2039 stop:2518 length:480 start_codon:yes stop_codon:yes gene_type:complete